jgi:plastocyanin
VSKLRAYFIILVALCLIGVFVWVFVAKSPSEENTSQRSGEQAATTPPPLSAEVIAMLAKSKGFQALVSYTERGFEPAVITLQKGDTVRFTNNSSRGLWVAATGVGGAVYPGTSEECGQSSFDTCKLLQPGEFWEFTFDTTGTWSYQNNSDVRYTGTVTIQ